jgi:hypothetical protein
MKATTAQARALMPLFEAVAAAAGLTTKNPIRVSVSTRNALPQMRAGTIYLPSVMVSMLHEADRGPIIFVRTFIHELQHAVDFFDERSLAWTRDEHEAHARAAERILDEAQMRDLVQQVQK